MEVREVWISCMERLPEKPGVYHVIRRASGHKPRFMDHCRYDGEGHWLNERGNRIISVEGWYDAANADAARS